MSGRVGLMLSVVHTRKHYKCNNVLADRGDFKMVLKKLLNVSRVASCSS